MIHQEPEEPTTEIKENATKLERALAEAKEQAERFLANWQRSQADFANYKRRSEQEKEEISQLANKTFIFSLLPVLDDLERAFAAIPPDLARVSWVEGIKLVERKLLANLEREGVSQIKAVGEPFDPRRHEAIRLDNGQEGIILEEVERGYQLHDRVLRASRVVVGNGQIAQTEGVEPGNNQ